METIYHSKSSYDENSNTVQIMAKSAPIEFPSESPERLLKVQISAPSYLHSLKENQAPPFRLPEPEAKPHLLIGTVVTENDVIQMIAAADIGGDAGLKKYLCKYLVNKKICQNDALSEKSFLVSLILECRDYAAQRDFSAFKFACFLTMYLSAHAYFKWYYWSSPIALWNFFKEIMIRHTIEDSPDGQEVFEPEECYDIISHFHTIYLSNLPLIHILTFSIHRLKLLWPFKQRT